MILHVLEHILNDFLPELTDESKSPLFFKFLCTAVHVIISFSLLSFLRLFSGIPYRQDGTPKIERESKGMRGHLHELPLIQLHSFFTSCSGGEEISGLHTSIFYHLYGGQWLCAALGWRECK